MSGFKLTHLALLGVTNSFLQMLCLRFLPLSFFQIMQTSVIIFIPLLARIFLKKTLYRWNNKQNNWKTHIPGHAPDIPGNRVSDHSFFFAWFLYKILFSSVSLISVSHVNCITSVFLPENRRRVHSPKGRICDQEICGSSRGVGHRHHQCVPSGSCCGILPSKR